MTYYELFDQLEGYLYDSVSPKDEESRKHQTVTVYIKELDEWYPIEKLCLTTETDVLDEGHLYLKTK